MKSRSEKETTMTNEKLLTRKDLQGIIPLSAVGLWKLTRMEGFPAPILLGKRRVAWKPETISAWIDGGGLASANS